MNPQMCFEQWVNSFEKRVITQVSVHLSNNTESRKGQPIGFQEFCVYVVITGSSVRVLLQNLKNFTDFNS